MKLKIMAPVTFDVKYMDVILPERANKVFYHCDDETIIWGDVTYNDIFEFYNKYPNMFMLDKGCPKLFLHINIETGKVSNWPENHKMDFYDVKIVDEGEYSLYDENGNEIVRYNGYVPNCIGEGGYGDYLEFEIDENGYIVDWFFAKSDLEEFFENAEPF